MSFSGIYASQLAVGTLTLPLFFFLFCATTCMLGVVAARYFWSDAATRGLFGFMAGEANVGFFGLPVIGALFGSGALNLGVLCSLGFALNESTIGYFVLARGRNSIRASLKKLVRLPLIYAFVLGLICNIIHVHLGGVYPVVVDVARFGFSFFGMMIVGLAIAGITDWKFDWKFVAAGVINKFIVWPTLMALLVLIDSSFVHIYSAEVHRIMLTISFVPIAASSVVFATQLRTYPEKASAAVVCSTLLAIIYVPLMVTLFVR